MFCLLLPYSALSFPLSRHFRCVFVRFWWWSGQGQANRRGQLTFPCLPSQHITFVLFYSSLFALRFTFLFHYFHLISFLQWFFVRLSYPHLPHVSIFCYDSLLYPLLIFFLFCVCLCVCFCFRVHPFGVVFSSSVISLFSLRINFRIWFLLASSPYIFPLFPLFPFPRASFPLFLLIVPILRLPSSSFYLIISSHLSVLTALRLFSCAVIIYSSSSSRLPLPPFSWPFSVNLL